MLQIFTQLYKKSLQVYATLHNSPKHDIFTQLHNNKQNKTIQTIETFTQLYIETLLNLHTITEFYKTIKHLTKTIHNFYTTINNLQNF